MGFFDLFRRKPEASADSAAPEPLPATVAAPEPARQAADTAYLDSLEQSAPFDVAAVERDARASVAIGYEDREDLAYRLCDEYEVTCDDQVIGRIVDRVWKERLDEQKTWVDGDSDYQRVARAFATLNSQGIVARENFSCCNTCGTSEIDAERSRQAGRADGYGYRESQYVFFHQQDAQRLVDEPAQLFLTYSAWRLTRDADPELLAAAAAGDAAARKQLRRVTDGQVGERVAEALRAEGLTVRWDGNPNARLAVDIRTWRKPLPAR
ncbi:hypothetical protein JT358_14260 [Micrococcales bacterium 31B]|nr:hypothetical protein [Micrococcales bacterium 31B]